MQNILLVALLVLLLAVAILQIVILRRKVAIDLLPVQQAFKGVEDSYLKCERVVREEIAQNRQEIAASLAQSREEMARSLKVFNESLVTNVGEIGKLQKAQLDVFSERLDKLAAGNEQKLDSMRGTVETKLTEMQQASGRELAQMRTDSASVAQKLREEITASLKSFGDLMVKMLGEIGSGQRTQLGNVVDQLTKLTEATEKKLDAQRTAVDERLKQIQDDNAKQLEQMRATVDEKLQGTLEKRLGESFRQVSERLEAVHKGLGEMQVLASGVGDLKKVLANVKTRGTWGEVQLGAMLEQVLTPEQFATNVCTKEGGERVEFAIKLPGRGEDRDEVVWLPIDAKFPMEDYQRLVDAQERGDTEAIEQAGRQLEERIKSCAWDICEKYLNPPKTTDFGILFLPTEGLFAEVVRRLGLVEYVQRECRVMFAGPTTLWSILNSLQMGFRTLAIQKRSSEVWKLLAAVKTEWSKYGEVLAKVQKKLQEASNTIEDAERRTRVIGRKLKNVQELPAIEAQAVLKLTASNDDGEAEDGKEL